jgi:very-short-patch-repair endonuclease
MNQSQYPYPDTLVGHLKRKRDLTILKKKNWYRIPVSSAPDALQQVEYLAFYQPAAAFDEDKWRVRYYGRKGSINVAKRIKLLPNEPGNKNRDEPYYQIEIPDLEELPEPILNKRRHKRIPSFIETTLHKLHNAEVIDDLFNDSPLEDELWRYLKENRIEAERQHSVFKEEGGEYFLDFAVFCQNGKIGIECEGKWHYNTPEQIKKDNERYNYLIRKGWHMMRFSKDQLDNPQECLNEIKKSVNACGGPLTEDGQLQLHETENSNGTTQLELFNTRSHE